MQRLGEAVGRQARAGDIVLLRGELGAGKTTWTQGLARALEVLGPVTSPTFVLQTEHQGANLTLLHLDAYRLEGADEAALRDAGVLDFLGRSEAMRVIEWPEMIQSTLDLYVSPQALWQIDIAHDGAARQVTVRAPREWELEEAKEAR
jgi:tRNA threonylcarbamoyladenosine biosynthesis protein TsaE